MSKPYKRSQRVSELLKREISEIIREMKDERKGFVTVTHVEVSNDLRHAKVYVSIFGEKKEEAFACLQEAKGFVRTQVAKRVRLRYTPSIKFEYDTSLEEGERIYQIFKDLYDEDNRTDNRKT